MVTEQACAAEPPSALKAPSVGFPSTLHPCGGTRVSHNELPQQMAPSPRSRPTCLSHENGGRLPDRCPPSQPGRAVGTRGHILTGCLERTLDKQPPLGASPAGGSAPQPCPSSTQKNDTCFPLLHTSPSSEATGWDCPAGWIVAGLVSVRRAPHFKGTPSPCDIVKSRVGMSAEPETAPREGFPPEPITSPSASALDSGAAQKGVTPPFICSFISSFYLSPIHSFNKCNEGKVMAVPPRKAVGGLTRRCWESSRQGLAQRCSH